MIRNKLKSHPAAPYIPLVVLAVVLAKGWESIIAFLGIVLTAIIPLLLGFAIAYVVSIPVSFLERHLFPHAQSSVANAARRPIALLLMLLVIVFGMIASSMEFIPALIDTVHMVQTNGRAFVMDLLKFPILAPIRKSVTEFLQGDLIETLVGVDIEALSKEVMGGAVGNIGAQVFGVVSGIMTSFFAILFSFILLTDTSEIGNVWMRLFADFFGDKRAERVALSLGIVDASFHNFIVRQFVEALILGVTATMVLLVAKFPYAVGTGVLMGLAALVPIVGYPIGLFASAFMVVINNPWLALIYVIVVAVTQVLEANLLLPHIGDPRTTIPPVLVTVGVTIGGGVAGFVGMLVAIPLAASVFQLLRIDARLMRDERGEESYDEYDEYDDVTFEKAGVEDDEGDGEPAP